MTEAEREVIDHLRLLIGNQLPVIPVRRNKPRNITHIIRPLRPISPIAFYNTNGKPQMSNYRTDLLQYFYTM
jgi:hypothetical protein